ncbi:MULTISPECIES: hypothetical protein [Chitinophaga]|uniref:hypothetical protein n=1 Tax=Chitinophaga TaxID=79328 RepID=UPI0009C58C70|nr:MULTISPECIES: hypothetical protein [Chitinophaga]OMP75181.1 hypothetical protein BW716_31510 [[Flexibacter] sp. ATCC 35208]WPQ60429.1 hypothetical protein SIO70_18955 [Chitinophaga sancti]WPV64602.1 hypothetical protein QQL36_22630 [Chitinophaga sp. LS1]
MKASYIIEVSIKTIRGYTAFCHYQLGSIPNDAERIFACMKGAPVNANGDAPFQINLIWQSSIKTVTLATQFCTLAELKENSHYISREVFKLLNLE